MIASSSEIHDTAAKSGVFGELLSNSGSVAPILWRSLQSRLFLLKPGHSLLVGMQFGGLRTYDCDTARLFARPSHSAGSVTCQYTSDWSGPEARSDRSSLTIVNDIRSETMNRVALVPHLAPAGAEVSPGTADSITVRTTDLFDYAIVREFDHGAEVNRLYGLAKITNGSSSAVVIDTILTHESTLAFLGLPEWIMPQSGVSGTLLPAGESIIFEFRSEIIGERFGNDPAKLLAAGVKAGCDLVLRGSKPRSVHFTIDLGAEHCRRRVRWNQQENRYEALDPLASIEVR